MSGDGGTNWIVGTVPVIVAGGMTGIGFIIRSAVSGVNTKFDKLEAAFSRVTADLAAQHAAMETRLDVVDRRLTRVESWKELVSLPDMQGRARRVSDRAFREGEDDRG